MRDFILALRWSSRPPGELVVALRGERLELPDTSFPVRQLELASGTSSWAARNSAALAANGDLLLFLESSCLAAPALVAAYASAAVRREGAFVGQVTEIPEGTVARGMDFDRFERLGKTGAAAEAGAEPVRRGDYGKFISTNFAISAADFAKIGGFPETEGGRRETEAAFGQRLAAANLPLWCVAGAGAFCEQQHEAVRAAAQRQRSGSGLVVAQKSPARRPLPRPLNRAQGPGGLPVS